MNSQGLVDYIEDMECKVFDEMNDILLSEFTTKEVKKAIDQMHSTKSMGIDGMSPLLYHKHWDMVSSDIIEVVLKPLARVCCLTS